MRQAQPSAQHVPIHVSPALQLPPIVQVVHQIAISPRLTYAYATSACSSMLQVNAKHVTLPV